MGEREYFQEHVTNNTIHDNYEKPQKITDLYYILLEVSKSQPKYRKVNKHNTYDECPPDECPPECPPEIIGAIAAAIPAAIWVLYEPLGSNPISS